MSKDSNSSTGIGFLGLLTIVFVTLRLIPYEGGHLINWSWWWVLAPIWLPFVFGIAVIVVVGLAAAVLRRTDKN